MASVWENIKKNKEGIIIGGIIGWVVGKFFIPPGFDFSVIMQSQSLLDNFFSVGKTSIDIAKNKVIIATTIIGATLGYITDSLFPERGFFRK